MKHFRLFSLFFGCWLLASCTADPGTEPGPFGENPPTAEKPHAVPVEQALEELQSVLEEIDIPAEDGAVTRSGGIRRVKNVTTVSPEVLNPDGTRSEATADVEDLLYIVNFEMAPAPTDASAKILLSFLISSLRTHRIYKLGVFRLPDQVYSTNRAVSLFCDDDFGLVGMFSIFVIVIITV